MHAEKNPLSRVLQKQVLDCLDPQVDPAHVRRALEYRLLRQQDGGDGAREFGVDFLRPTPEGVRPDDPPNQVSNLSGVRFGYLTVPNRYIAMPALEHPRRAVAEAVCGCGAVVLRSMDQLRLCESLEAGCLGAECPHSSGFVRFWHNRAACLALQHLAMLGSQQKLLPYRWGGPEKNFAEDLEDVSEVACRRRFVEEVTVFLTRGGWLGRDTMWVHNPSPPKNPWPAAPNRLTYQEEPSSKVFPHRKILVSYGGHVSELRQFLKAMQIKNPWEFMDSLNLMRYSFEECVDRFISGGDSKWT